MPLYPRLKKSTFTQARLRADTEVREVLTRDMLFADKAALVRETAENLVDRGPRTCKEFNSA